MFGDPLGAMLKSKDAIKSSPNPETLKLIEAVLDYIRSNLSNIRNTWGADSPQYRSATEVMDKYLETNMKQLNVEKPDLAELMQNISLQDPPK